ncbi:GMC family oxidoreductase N-terminal domain-containing protein [soil metagenome]
MGEACDFLVIGGGSAGAIVARRLADRSKGRVILLEAGKSDEADMAAIDLSRVDDLTPAHDWGFTAPPVRGGALVLDYARAKMLGGCGNHNDCAFLVPPDCDFTAWEAAGAKGWGPETTAKYFDRIEERVTVERAPRHRLSEVFVAAGRELGLPEVDFRRNVVNGTGWFPLNAKGPMRESSSVSYLHPLKDLPRNLDVWTETRALKLTFDGARATGALTTRGPVTASRAVILTCGSLQTPQLMMISGIGPAAALRKHGIGVLRDLPGIGQHLLDHPAAPVVYETRDGIEPWDITPYQATTLISIDGDAPAPDVLFHFGLRVREKYGENPQLAVSGPAVKLSPNVARARSEGEVRLASGDINDAPVIDLNYFSDPQGYDRRILIAGLRYARRLGETRAFQAIAKREVHPGPGVQTDAEWIEYIGRVCETVYHPSGTCRMGDPSDPRIVVSPDLRVKGVDGLFVADASVFPALVTVNINNTVMMVGEKAVDHILA